MKKKALKVLEEGNCQFLDIFRANDATHDQISRAGEMFVLKLYGANERCQSLDDWRYVAYMRIMKKIPKKKSSSLAPFPPESLPPTSVAMRYHAYRAYFAVQEWSGNFLLATDWGTECIDDMLISIYTDRPAASDSVLRMVSCGCKTDCGKRCSCRKAGMDCSAMCSKCIGRNCTNVCPFDGNNSDTETS